MDFQRSPFGEKLSQPSGILELMNDLGEGLTTNRDAIMMGGGNPAQIPKVQEVWREQARRLVDDANAIGNVLANYDPPSGNPAFLQSLATFLKSHCGWQVTEKNLAVTMGGQTGLFFLLNLFSGGGRKILLPLMPEYIGYSNQLADPDAFVTHPAKLELRGDHRFKYHVDFESLEIGDDIGAICVSRPTNPSANVLTDDEIQRLAALAEEHGIPLIIDNAYGHPFPGVIFSDAKPFWNSHVIQTLSLSKLGLPGTRTGIVVANEDIAGRIAAMTAVAGLANNNFGQALVKPLLEGDQLIKLCDEVIRPYYAKRCEFASGKLDSELSGDIPYRLHETEGAFFLWLWLEDLPITSRELYLRLKERGVIVVPGEYFFYDLKEDWQHQRQCLRISYTQPHDRVEKGLGLIGDEIKKVYQGL
tara:strand:- start:49173 stop:50423 length:1251 start_codon:yes stop_codon:yes gene_type:complete